MSVYQQVIKHFYDVNHITQQDVDHIEHPVRQDLHSEPFHSQDEYLDALHAASSKVITVDPDYDGDGVMSGLTLKTGLVALGVGRAVNIYYPTTKLGYGLTPAAVDALLKQFPDTEVLLTTDNGVAAFDGIKYAKSLGLTVLVSDHHLGKIQQPDADVLVDPNADHDPYPFKGISGTTVIWKLLLAYASKYAPDKYREINTLAVLAGISTVTDMMPLRDENRFLVVGALKAMNLDGWALRMADKYPALREVMYGLEALHQSLRKHGKIMDGVDAGTLGFYVGPMLNAPRRVLEISDPAFAIFEQLSVEDAVLATENLFEINEERKRMKAQLVDDMAGVINYDLSGITALANCGNGFAGLLAGDIVNAKPRPTIAFSCQIDGLDSAEVSAQDLDTLAKNHVALSGSGRSPAGVSIIKILDEIAAKYPDAILSYGGHAAACGVKVDAAHYAEFCTVFDAVAKTELANLITDQKSDAMTITFDGVGDDLVLGTWDDVQLVGNAVAELGAMAPFGTGFAAPQFELQLDLRQVMPLGKTGAHAKWTLPHGLVVLDWNAIKAVNRLRERGVNSVLVSGEISQNKWRDRVTVQLIVKSMREVA